ncbi:MAG: hypothetical protein PWR12_429 [Eubacteriaceae bacterium]|nr:hypothetical protein [Eubacteriaceae bacterium]
MKLKEAAAEPRCNKKGGHCPLFSLKVKLILNTLAPTIGFSVVRLGANSCQERLKTCYFYLGNCTHPRADYEIQLVGAGFVYKLKVGVSPPFSVSRFWAVNQNRLAVLHRSGCDQSCFRHCNSCRQSYQNNRCRLNQRRWFSFGRLLCRPGLHPLLP